MKHGSAAPRDSLPRVLGETPIKTGPPKGALSVWRAKGMA
jgi:hypothetical protein